MDKQKKGIWFNALTSKAGKKFYRSDNVNVGGKEVQMRIHPTQSGKLVLHFDEPYDRSTQDVLAELGE